RHGAMALRRPAPEGRVARHRGRPAPHHGGRRRRPARARGVGAMSGAAADARIPRLSADEARAAAQAAGVPAMMAELSVFQVLLRNPKVAKALQDMLTA